MRYHREYAPITLTMLCFAAFAAVAGNTEIALMIAFAAFVVPHLDSFNEQIGIWQSARGSRYNGESGRGVVYDYYIPARSVRTFAAVAIAAGFLGTLLFLTYQNPQDGGLWVVAALMTLFFVFILSCAVAAVRQPSGLGMRIDCQTVFCCSPWPRRREWTIRLEDIRRVIVWNGEGDRMMLELKDDRRVMVPMNAFGPSALPAIEALHSVAPQIPVTTMHDTWPAMIGSIFGRQSNVDEK